MRVYQPGVRRIRAIDPGHVGDFYWANNPVSITVLQDGTPRDKPNGEWFVFHLDTGRTIQTPPLKNAKKARMEFIQQRGK